MVEFALLLPGQGSKGWGRGLCLGEGSIFIDLIKKTLRSSPKFPRKFEGSPVDNFVDNFVMILLWNTLDYLHKCQWFMIGF